MYLSGIATAYGVFAVATLAVYVQVSLRQPAMLYQYWVCTVISILCVWITKKIIPSMKSLMIDRGLWGYDINKGKKSSTLKIPESFGVVAGLIFICAVLLQSMSFFPEDLVQYNASLLSVCMMMLLGFLDDVLDIRWRIKILLSCIATLPLLVAYSGPTNILVPRFLRHWIVTLHLGYFYHLYMALIIVFCTNGINIYAGINGLETSQTIVVTCAILVHNSIELSGPCAVRHMQSIQLMLPFLATVLVLGYFNAYPSDVFVGDSFTYFAGMTIAVAAIQGHFSKTLMLFCLPQLLNFLISLPQLLGVLPCPQHRVPIYVEHTDRLRYSQNLTLINAALFVLGPTSEKNLCQILTLFHVVTCLLGLAIRYSHTITDIFYYPHELFNC